MNTSSNTAFRTTKTSTLAATLAAFALSMSACAMEDTDGELNDEDVIAAALELENGGLDLQDEAPMFGNDAVFDSAGESDSMEVSFTDAMEEDPAVVADLGQVDGVLYHTTVMWGQIPGDRTNDTVYNWTGSLRVNRGAIIIRSVLAFDGRTDHIVPRDNPRVVAFTSATLPHRDGLRLLIVDPTPAADEPLTLTYTQYREDGSGDTFSANMIDMLDGPQSQTMDDAGNRIVAVAMRQPVDICENGFMGGRWHKVADGRGRILGRVVNARGDILGHMRGVYGVRANGNRVFFGKYINRDGQFRGLYRGTYGDGHFVGRWITRDGDVGALRGEYRETIEGPEVGGHYLGRWAETRCNLGNITDDRP